MAENFSIANVLFIAPGLRNIFPLSPDAKELELDRVRMFSTLTALLLFFSVRAVKNV